MERLGDIVARVLANVRVTMDGEMAGEAAGEDAASPLAQRLGGDSHARKGDAHPRSSSRRVAKKATGMAAKISIER